MRTSWMRLATTVSRLGRKPLPCLSLHAMLHRKAESRNISILPSTRLLPLSGSMSSLCMCVLQK